MFEHLRGCLHHQTNRDVVFVVPFPMLRHCHPEIPISCHLPLAMSKRNVVERTVVVVDVVVLVVCVVVVVVLLGVTESIVDDDRLGSSNSWWQPNTRQVVKTVVVVAQGIVVQTGHGVLHHPTVTTAS